MSTRRSDYTDITYLRRDESEMDKAAEEIIASSEYAAYGGMGKESLRL